MGKTGLVVRHTPVERRSVVFLAWNDVQQVLLELGLDADRGPDLSSQDHRIAIHAWRQQRLGGLKLAGPPGKSLVPDVAPGG